MQSRFKEDHELFRYTFPIASSPPVLEAKAAPPSRGKAADGKDA